jgi:hypothetical protein
MDYDNEAGTVALTRSRRITPHRPVKVQICLTPDERAQLAERARAAGYDTVSAFVRARTLGPVRAVR